MVWSWSHTNEAYVNARKNLESLDDEDLRNIYAEHRIWQVENDENSISPDDPLWDMFKNEADNFLALARDTFLDELFSLAQEHSNCDNGGHYLWMCPYGCEIHKVSCDDLPD